LPATLQLSGTAFIFSVVLGVGIGCWRPPRPDTMVDRLGQVLAVAGQSMPVFWTAILLILFSPCTSAGCRTLAASAAQA